MTTAPASRPRVAGADGPAVRFAPSVREAWRLWRAHLGEFAIVALAVVVPLLAVAEVLTHRFEVVGDAVRVGVLLIAGVALAAFGEALCAGLAEHVLYRTSTGRSRTSLWLQARSLPLATLAGIALVVAVAVAVGWALFVVPALVAFAWLAVASPVASFERLGVVASLRRAVALVRGHFWRVAALTSLTFAPFAVADTVGVALHAQHAPAWVVVLVEAVVEAAAISLTAAVVVVIYRGLCDREPAR
jgi:hypothetical protein